MLCVVYYLLCVLRRALRVVCRVLFVLFLLGDALMRVTMGTVLKYCVLRGLHYELYIVCVV